MRARTLAARTRARDFGVVAPKGAEMITPPPHLERETMRHGPESCNEPRVQIILRDVAPVASPWPSSFTCDIALNLFGVNEATIKVGW